MSTVHEHASNVLRLRRLGIDTYQEPVVYMPADCPVCRSEGWEAQSRVLVSLDDRSVIATLNVVTDTILLPEEISLSDVAWSRLGAEDGEEVVLSHPPPLTSLALVRRKLYGQRLADGDFAAVIRDIVAGRYSAIELTAFVSACAGGRLDLAETVGLTRAMVDVGERLRWHQPIVVDKHSVGGLPGNRTTMLVVPIVAAAGLTMPKTSSRAITSPAGTADAMETVAPVELDVPAMRKVVDREGGCIVWGGAVNLSPADDLIIRVERPLDLDSEGQLVASVLSKKAAAGSTHVVIDMPIGPTAKVRDRQAATTLAALLTSVGRDVGLVVEVCEGDGTQPIGRGVGPALEARDVLSVLRGDPNAPPDLKDRALVLAGRIIETGGRAAPGTGIGLARAILEDGRALRKFEAICEAQGGMRAPPIAPLTRVVTAPKTGRLAAVDNRRLARTAKLAGAPDAPAAGLEMLVRIGDVVSNGQPLFVLHAQSPGEVEYALAFVDANPDILSIVDEK
ncbi:MAG TPA: thymidine phosphorylase family protein [Gemmatimonadaceae bacterium]|nr:thymidine phosphorylase family protein [Gemmatimonadaceae bacterium]